MEADFGHLAASATVALAPFIPFLLDAGKASGKKLAEVVAAQGGEAAWRRAQNIWHAVYARWGQTPEVQGAAVILADQPGDVDFRSAFAKVLRARLQESPELARQVADLLCDPALQEILADQRSRVGDVEQRLKGVGVQRVRSARGSTIDRVKQVIE